MLPAMVKVAENHADYQFVVAGAPSIEPEFYEQYLQQSSVRIVYEDTYALLQCSMAGLITSGTATLEAALFDVPQVVLYKTGRLAYGIGKRLIKINFISLVKLIFGKELVKEVIQKDLYDRSKAYVDRETEIEAFEYTINEARKIGLSEEEILDYLSVEWITPEEYRRLADRLGVGFGSNIDS